MWLCGSHLAVESLDIGFIFWGINEPILGTHEHKCHNTLNSSILSNT